MLKPEIGAAVFMSAVPRLSRTASTNDMQGPAPFSSSQAVREDVGSNSPFTDSLAARMHFREPDLVTEVGPAFSPKAAVFDIVIVGGGLSGLALAAELATPALSHLTVLVLEQRQAYRRDRTWSYWKTPNSTPHRYSHLERQSWMRWRVQQADPNNPKTAASSVTNSSQKLAYGTLDADAFYTAALQTIAQNKQVELRLGVSVQQIVGGRSPAVITGDGDVIAATWVFDARPPVKSASADLVQQFLGYEISTNRDVFDVTALDLMHFYPSPSGLHFFYVLPYGPRNALVETTWISPASFKPDFERELRQHIAGLIGSAAYEVMYSEKGSLNLCPKLNDAGTSNTSRVVALGRGAGTLRASTGYAFLDTLAYAEHIAASLKQHGAGHVLADWMPPAFSRPALDRWMDSIFLSKLALDWRTSSDYFMQMFKRVDAATLVAFLSGGSTLRQRWTVALALPILPFLLHLLSMAFAKLRDFVCRRLSNAA